MRLFHTLANVLAAVSIGIVLPTTGLTIATWQFWAVIALILVLQVNAFAAGRAGAGGDR